MIKIIYESSLYHHGILGQKWGVRRYQNKDGSLTPAGRKKYKKDSTNKSNKLNTGTQKQRKLTKNTKKAINIGIAAVSAALAVYGTYKLVDLENLSGFIQTGRKSVSNLGVVEGGSGFSTDYDRWAKVNDMRIRNHSRL